MSGMIAPMVTPGLRICTQTGALERDRRRRNRRRRESRDQTKS